MTSIIGWAEKFGFDFDKDGGTDGMNEKGLAAHLLYLEATGEYPKRGTEGKPGVTYMRLVRYVLDNFATVAEAIAGLQEVNILMVEITKCLGLGAHLAIEDPSGDSCIVEILQGVLKIHHSIDSLVMTNDPPYQEQLELLAGYEGFGGKAATTRIGIFRGSLCALVILPTLSFQAQG